MSMEHRQSQVIDTVRSEPKQQQQGQSPKGKQAHTRNKTDLGKRIAFLQKKLAYQKRKRQELAREESRIPTLTETLPQNAKQQASDLQEGLKRELRLMSKNLQQQVIDSLQKQLIQELRQEFMADSKDLAAYFQALVEEQATQFNAQLARLKSEFEQSFENADKACATSLAINERLEGLLSEAQQSREQALHLGQENRLLNKEGRKIHQAQIKLIKENKQIKERNMELCNALESQMQRVRTRDHESQTLAENLQNQLHQSNTLEKSQQQTLKKTQKLNKESSELLFILKNKEQNLDKLNSKGSRILKACSHQGNQIGASLKAVEEVKNRYLDLHLEYSEDRKKLQALCKVSRAQLAQSKQQQQACNEATQEAASTTLRNKKMAEQSAALNKTTKAMLDKFSKNYDKLKGALDEAESSNRQYQAKLKKITSLNVELSDTDKESQKTLSKTVKSLQNSERRNEQLLRSINESGKVIDDFKRNVDELKECNRSSQLALRESQLEIKKLRKLNETLELNNQQLNLQNKMNLLDTPAANHIGKFNDENDTFYSSGNVRKKASGFMSLLLLLVFLIPVGIIGYTSTTPLLATASAAAEPQVTPQTSSPFFDSGNETTIEAKAKANSLLLGRQKSSAGDAERT